MALKADTINTFLSATSKFISGGTLELAMKYFELLDEAGIPVREITPSYGEGSLTLHIMMASNDDSAGRRWLSIEFKNNQNRPNVYMQDDRYGLSMKDKWSYYPFVSDEMFINHINKLYRFLIASVAN